LIGSAIMRHFISKNDSVIPLVREKTPGREGIFWNYQSGEIESEKMENADAIIHLAGENIMGRWSKNKKAAIFSSRVEGTKLIKKTITQLKNPPKVFICASAIGFYGAQRGNETLVESSSAGDDFLADTCKKSTGLIGENIYVCLVLFRLRNSFEVF